MLERWHSWNAWKRCWRIAPYLLFYIGIGLHFGSWDQPSVFSACRFVEFFFSFVVHSIFHRIMLAIDLELYYILSLRFLRAFEFFGPKLVMIRKMVTNSRLYCDVNFAIYSKHLVSRSTWLSLHNICVCGRLWCCFKFVDHVRPA
jgi:hypothetical protein